MIRLVFGDDDRRQKNIPAARIAAGNVGTRGNGYKSGGDSALKPLLEVACKYSVCLRETCGVRSWRTSRRRVARAHCAVFSPSCVIAFGAEIAGKEIFLGVAVVLEECPHGVFDSHTALVDLFEFFHSLLGFGFGEFELKGVELTFEFLEVCAEFFAHTFGVRHRESLSGGVEAFAVGAGVCVADSVRRRLDVLKRFEAGLI